jgi:dipeptidase D
MASVVAANTLITRDANLEAYAKLSSGASPLVSAFWKYLLLCFETPRPSTNFKEPDDPKRLDAIRSALSKVAVHLGAEVSEVPGGSLLITRAGRGQGASKASLCLQGHMDIVCSQNDGVGHDFERDGIEVRFTDDDGQPGAWLKPVKATTLGADNGVALAAGLAVLEVQENHPPLELLFTSNEETDFLGAESLPPGALKSERLLNLDSEEEYSICVGCAGGFEHSFKLPLTASDVGNDLVVVSVTLSGLHGGHSGVDIHKEYGNANKLLARLMLQVGCDVRLMTLKGGTGPSAIPREASCTVLSRADDAGSFCEAVRLAAVEICEEFKSVEPSMDLQVSHGTTEPLAANSTTALSSEDTRRVWQFCVNVPHGVLRMSTDVPGLVESSVSFGLLELKADHLFCHLFARSSVNSFMKQYQRTLTAFGDMCGAHNIENQFPFAAWQPCMESNLLETCKRTHKEEFDGKDPRVYAIHAGLECGVLMQSHPKLDCSSIGPLIVNAHSPDERIHVASGARYMSWLQRILENVE